MSLSLKSDAVAGKLGANLRRLRRAQNLTQEAVAKGIGLEKAAQVSQWEGGKRAPNRENVRRLATFFGVQVHELDPDHEAWDAERPRSERQNHHPPSQSHVAAPPQPPAGIAMGPGDRVLWDQFVGVWMLCRSDEERHALVDHVRAFVEHPSTERQPKKAAR